MTLPATFDVTLEFLSDWHIGTGQGRLGAVDAEVRRDADNLPFVPAKTLVGVWRDACETVADTFDRAATGAQEGAWRAWVTWLFGSQAGRVGEPPGQAARPPVPAALRLTPARAPRWLRAGVRDRPALAQAAVVLRPGVKIDDKTGTAVDRFLRVEERAIRALRLESQVSVAVTDGTGELPGPAELLLRAGAKLVEGVGGKRNRGSGRVAVLLPGARVEDADRHPTVIDPRLVALLADGAPAAPPPPPWRAGAAEIHPYDRLHPDRRRTVRIVLRVLTPVVAAHDVLGNVVTGRDTIPGTALLGTILARTAPAGGGGSSRIGLADLSVGDAVPAYGDPRNPGSVLPARPAPLVWRRSDKGRGPKVYNTIGGDAEPDRAKQMSGWVVRTGDRWRPVSLAKAVSTHAVVDDEARRPTVDSGGVYTYVGMAPGTLLCADVRLPVGVRLRLDLGERLRFGRSRKDDFGLVEVVGVVDPVPGTGRGRVAAADPGLLRVWCVSDVLLRDERLAPDPSPEALARSLAAALGPASVVVVGDGTQAKVSRREGFGVAWGRPRSSQVALRAGSVVTLFVTGEVDPDRLAGLERDGIGERTVEGYGRVLFNPPELEIERPAVNFPGPPRPSATADNEVPGTGVDSHSDQVLGLGEPVHPIEVNAWRRAIRRASARLRPTDLLPGIDRLAGNRAQLGSLRAQVERLALPNGPEMIRHWLAGTKAVKARRNIWTEEVLTDLAVLLLDDPTQVWQRLKLDGPQPSLVLAPGREDALRRLLHTEALTVTLTDMLRRLTRATTKEDR